MPELPLSYDEVIKLRKKLKVSLQNLLTVVKIRHVLIVVTKRPIFLEFETKLLDLLPSVPSY